MLPVWSECGYSLWRQGWHRGDTNIISLDDTLFCLFIFIYFYVLYIYIIVIITVITSSFSFSKMFPEILPITSQVFSRLRTRGWSSDRSAVRRLRRLQLASTDFSTLPSLPGQPVVVDALSPSLCSGKLNASSATNVWHGTQMLTECSSKAADVPPSLLQP